jgi:hypothetical protein
VRRPARALNEGAERRLGLLAELVEVAEEAERDAAEGEQDRGEEEPIHDPRIGARASRCFSCFGSTGRGADDGEAIHLLQTNMCSILSRGAAATPPAPAS